MSKSVLVVEDDDMIREMIDLVLTQNGYAVALARNGAVALEILGRTRFDLVILDHHMPQISGLDLLEAARRRGKTLPPVLMVTANRAPETVTTALALGCVGYLAKPFTNQTLLSRVAAAIRDGRPQPRVIDA